MTDLFDLPFEEEPAPEPEPERMPAAPKGDPREGRAASPQPLAPSPRRVWSVTELTVRVLDLLEEEFAEIWVECELSNCRVWNTGHLYFTLKDGASQIKAVIFRSALR